VKPILRRPLGWASVALALLTALAMTFAYIGAFLDPAGNMRALPIALVSEDNGPLGARATSAITATVGRDGAVAWMRLSTRADALGVLRRDRAFAAIVIPRDYSRRLLAAARVPSAPPTSVEILTNPAAGSYARAAGDEAATAAATAVTDSLFRRLAPSSTRAIYDIVQIRTSEAVAISAKSARGLAPFYFALMLALAGFLGAVIVNLGVEVTSGRLPIELLGQRVERPGQSLSNAALWRAKLTLVLTLALVAGVLQTVLAVWVLGMSATNSVALALFAVLGVAATATTTLAFLVPFGIAGSLAGVLFVTIFGVPSSGGPYPLQLVPGFFRFLGEWLPLRYITDGARALVFLNGRLDAGLGRALWVLAVYALGGTVVSGITAVALDRRSKV
jgi:uncharacterized phage infection (PIP) family protein YhgE